MTTPNTKHSETEAYRVCGWGHANAAEFVHMNLLDRNIGNTDSTWLALQNLIGFAGENALKAYLSSHGIECKTLKKEFGHDLGKMLTRAIEFGLIADGKDHSQPKLVAALSKYISDCGNDFRWFNYRYLERDAVTTLSAGTSTTTVIKAIECVLDIVERKGNSHA